MTPLPELVSGAPVPCFMVPEYSQQSCNGCMFAMIPQDGDCTQSNTDWRLQNNRLCGLSGSIFIPATREAFDAHQLNLIAARLTT